MVQYSSLWTASLFSSDPPIAYPWCEGCWYVSFGQMLSKSAVFSVIMIGCECWIRLRHSQYLIYSNSNNLRYRISDSKSSKINNKKAWNITRYVWDIWQLTFFELFLKNCMFRWILVIQTVRCQWASSPSLVQHTLFFFGFLFTLTFFEGDTESPLAPGYSTF